MPTDEATIEQMISVARSQRFRAYSPYSQFAVGAAALGGSGRVYPGSNVENASYGLTVCAERVAIFRAVSEGEREITAIAICAGDDVPAPPCGACLQVIAEFSPPGEPASIITCTSAGSHEVRTLHDLLPRAFRLRNP